jgi:hypothetical protein
MKSKILLGALSVSMVLLAGCAGMQAPKPLTAQDIVARYAKALYGSSGAPKHSSMTMKGTLSIEQFGLEGPVVRYATAPDSAVTTMELMGASISNGCHKGACWAQVPGAGTMELTGAAAAMQLQQADYTVWQHLDRYYATIEIVPPAAGTESTIHKIKAAKANGDTDIYEFSKETGLLRAAVIEGETPQGRMTIGVQFANYKDFDGMLVPVELTQSTPQATLKLAFSDVSFAPIAEDKFAKPK